MIFFFFVIETYEAELRDELVQICDYMGRISMLFGDEFVIEREIYRLPINDYEQFNELLKFYRPGKYSTTVHLM